MTGRFERMLESSDCKEDTILVAEAGRMLEVGDGRVVVVSAKICVDTDVRDTGELERMLVYVVNEVGPAITVESKEDRTIEVFDSTEDTVAVVVVARVGTVRAPRSEFSEENALDTLGSIDEAEVGVVG